MKIAELTIENYGIFPEKRILFEGGGFHLVVGPNEAGKTTLLQAIREALFGFAYQNPYGFGADARKNRMAAEAVLQLRDGRQLRFRRRKGRPDAVEVERLAAAGSQPGSEADLREAMGGASEELFSNVFGFSLRELIDGEESLKNARLSEALFGAGMGSPARLDVTCRQIERQMAELFLTRGERPHINRLLRRLQLNQDSLRAAIVTPAEYERRAQELQEYRRRVEEVGVRRDRAVQEKARVDRLLQAIPVWSELKERRRQLDGTPAAPPNAPAVLQQYEHKRESLETARQEFKQAEEKEKELRRRLGHLVLHPELLEQQAAIRELSEGVAQIKAHRRDLPLRQEERKTTLEQVAGDLAALHPDWGLDALERFRANRAQMQAIDELARAIEALEKAETSLQSQRQQQQTQLNEYRARLEELGEPADIAPLQAVLRRADEYHSNFGNRRQLERQLRAGREKLAQQAARLAALVGAADCDAATVETPSLTAVEEFHERFQRAEDDLREAQRQREAEEGRLADAEAELERQEQLHPAPPREAVVQQRDRRDAGWRLIRRRYIEGALDAEAEIAAWTSAAAADLADLYEEAVAEADRLADERQEKAEAAARRDQLALEVHQRTSRLERARERETAYRNAKEDLDAAWQALWQPSGIAPRSPGQMRDWLRQRDEYLSALETLREEASRREDLAERIDRFYAELRQAMNLPADAEQPPIDVLLERAQRQVEKANEDAARWKTAREEVPKLERQLRQTDEHLEAITGRKVQFDQRRTTLLAEIGLPPQWSLATAKEVLAELKNLRTKSQEAENLQRRIDGMAADIRNYEQKASPLVARLAPDLAAVQAELAVGELVSRLDAAITAAAEEKNLREQQASCDSRIERFKNEIQTLENELRELLKRAGADSEDQLRAFAQAAETRERLAREIAERESRLAGIRGNEAEEAFHAQLGAADQAELAAQANRLATELRELNAAHEQAVEQRRDAQNRLDEVDQQHRADDLSAEREGLLAELVGDVERYAPLALAHRLLDEAITHFQEKRQPELLQQASRLIKKMTAGRYVALDRGRQSENWLLRDEHGNEKTPDKLSTGTREQLYLAIRLAYVQHYCHGAEPLPMVMDDVLVNFDDQRAEATLRVLLELAKDCQMIFMTCHQSMVDLVARVAPNVRPIELAAAG